MNSPQMSIENEVWKVTYQALFTVLSYVVIYVYRMWQVSVNGFRLLVNEFQFYLSSVITVTQIKTKT
jgi:hypothetical protein